MTEAENVLRSVVAGLLFIGMLPIALYVGIARVNVSIPMRFCGIEVSYGQRDGSAEEGISTYGSEDMHRTIGPVLVTHNYVTPHPSMEYPLIPVSLSVYWRQKR